MFSFLKLLQPQKQTIMNTRNESHEVGALHHPLRNDY